MCQQRATGSVLVVRFLSVSSSGRRQNILYFVTHRITAGTCAHRRGLSAEYPDAQLGGGTPTAGASAQLLSNIAPGIPAVLRPLNQGSYQPEQAAGPL